MALTVFQQHVCGLLAERRIDEGEAYVAGGTALNAILMAPRISRDIDRFHDTAEAVRVSSDLDRALLVARGLSVAVVRELRGFVKAVVRDGSGAAVVTSRCSRPLTSAASSSNRALHSKAIPTR